MALFTPSESPAIIVKEIDLTGGVPNVQSTTGAIAGRFNWGPVEYPILVSNEAGLVTAFGAPTADESIDFLSAAYFLRYSNSLYVARGNNGGVNAHAEPGALSLGAPTVKNDTDFDNSQASLDSDNYLFIAKYPGALGNSLQVSFCQDSSNFSSWTYASEFSGAPGTSSFASTRGAASDEFHVVVIDEDGLVSGTAGTVLESFAYVSKASNHLNTDGSTNYAPEVINRRSQYIRMAGFSSSAFPSNAGTAAASGTDYRDGSFLTNTSFSFADGSNGSALSQANLETTYDLFDDVDAYQVDFLIAPNITSRADHKTMVNDLISKAENTRKDCVVVASPARADVVDLAASTAVTNTVTAMNDLTYSSYAVFDNNYLKVYDKYNDKYVWIPAASSTAGIMAASDQNTAPWFSPAGPRRGRYFGVTALSYSPTKTQRDTLYKAGINPIANIPGQGVLLYGDKTHLTRVSAFDRINVRRLFLVLERAIARAAVNTLFEFNDEFTRAEFVNIVEPVLRNVKGRRGITDFRVVCDETNNTPDIVDRNEFIASIFIKPARSINYITLNFVGVRSGVDFEEVVGTI